MKFILFAAYFFIAWGIIIILTTIITVMIQNWQHSGKIYDVPHKDAFRNLPQKGGK